MNEPPLYPDCISPEDLARYYAGELTDVRNSEIEQHLYACSFCLGLSDKIADAVQAELEADLANIRQRALEPSTRSRVMAAWETLQDTPWREHLERWQQGALTAVRVATEAGKLALSREGLDVLLAPTAPAMDPLYVADERGSQGVEVGGYRGVLDNGAHLVVRQSRGLLAVNLDQWPSDTPPPMVVVVASSGEVGVHPLNSVGGNDYSARVRLPEGETIVLLELVAD